MGWGEGTGAGQWELCFRLAESAVKLHFQRERVWEECWQKGAVNKGLYAAVILETGFAISLRTHQFLCIPELIFINQVSKNFYFFLKSTRSNISRCVKAEQWGVVQEKLAGLLWLKGLPRFHKDLAVLLPQKKQIIPGSIRNKNPWTFLAMLEIWVRVCEWEIPSLPSLHTKDCSNCCLYPGLFKDADELHGNYHCSFKVFKFASLQ